MKPDTFHKYGQTFWHTNTHNPIPQFLKIISSKVILPLSSVKEKVKRIRDKCVVDDLLAVDYTK